MQQDCIALGTLLVTEGKLYDLCPIIGYVTGGGREKRIAEILRVAHLTTEKAI